MDTIAASIIAGGDEPPPLFAWIDIVAPAVISVLTIPSNTYSPFPYLVRYVFVTAVFRQLLNQPINIGDVNSVG